MKILYDYFKKLTPEKAYILGVVGPGDGFILTRDSGVSLSVIDKDFADKFKYCLEKVYGHKCKESLIKPTGFSKNFRYNVSLYSRNVVRDIKKYNVEFKESNWAIPFNIKRASNEVKHAYISGFADSQGSVHKREVLMFSQNELGIEDFNKILLELELRSTIQTRKDSYIISVHSRKSLEYFDQNIGFSIMRKREKLRKILSNYKRYYTPIEVVNKLNPEIKKCINRGYSQRKTARILGISQNAVRNRILGGILK
jgi:hypothetical protein